MAHGYPILLDVTRARVVIVGGGRVAARKAKGLIDAGATDITVVAPDFIGDELIIVSHRTQFGHGDTDRIDLRQAARMWMRRNAFFSAESLGRRTPHQARLSTADRAASALPNRSVRVTWPPPRKN